ncbi:MAG: hypothetical protein ABJC89_23030 [Acidobacteriota bacterium]
MNVRQITAKARFKEALGRSGDSPVLPDRRTGERRSFASACGFGGTPCQRQG